MGIYFLHGILAYFQDFLQPFFQLCLETLELQEMFIGFNFSLIDVSTHNGKRLLNDYCLMNAITIIQGVLKSWDWVLTLYEAETAVSNLSKKVNKLTNLKYWLMIPNYSYQTPGKTSQKPNTVSKSLLYNFHSRPANAIFLAGRLNNNAWIRNVSYLIP